LRVCGLRPALALSLSQPSGAIDITLYAKYKRLSILQHSCGYVLANRGLDKRSLQHYLGHRVIANTVPYAEMSADGSIGLELSRASPPNQLRRRRA
jgi:hypothetical protein